MKFHLPTELLYSRNEPEDPRLGELAKMVSLKDFEKSKWDLAIMGFPDDRGVALNRGRVGAAEGPAAIRKWFYRLTPCAMSARIADLGDMVMSEDLIEDHKRASEAIAIARGRARRVVILGGGHDWGYSPIAAMKQGGSVGFINFDAHLDVRPSELQHSGTSYWRALETCVQGEHAFWYGLQEASTASLHAEYARAKGGTLHYAGDSDDIVGSAVETWNACDAVDLSLDMDVFHDSDAPGVSAPQPAGLRSEEVLGHLRTLLELKKVRTFGIYELAPPLDSQESTARLAARCLWEAVRAIASN